ncbi:MAG: FeoB-associated Cys-rich membrane protein [Clostridia bacterium]|nr:FeoB-associated Cys-rich membrane protein [Clostridia bacterium]
MKPVDWILIGIVAGAVAAAAALLARRKKRGGSCCSVSNCGDCSACAKNIASAQKKADK